MPHKVNGVIECNNETRYHIAETEIKYPNLLNEISFWSNNIPTF